MLKNEVIILDNYDCDYFKSTKEILMSSHHFKLHISTQVVFTSYKRDLKINQGMRDLDIETLKNPSNPFLQGFSCT